MRKLPFSFTRSSTSSSVEKGLGEGAPTAPYTGSLSSLLMAPKIDKKVQQAAAKKIEDSTFGMKNKNKCVAQPRKSKRVGSARWP